MIGRDAQQVLVKHGSTYIRVHPCNLQLKNHNREIDIPPNSETENGPTESDRNTEVANIPFQTVKVLYDDETENNVLEVDNGNNSVTELDKNASSQNDANSFYSGQEQPKVKDFVEYQVLGSGENIKAQIISRAGKTSGKYSDWFNTRNIDDNSISTIDWTTVEKWKLFSQEEVLVCYHNELPQFEIMNAKLEELDKWKSHNVYDLVDKDYYSFITRKQSRYFK